MKKDLETVKRYIFFAKGRLGERMSGQIKELAFRMLDSALDDFEKDHKKEVKDGKRNADK